MKEKKKSFLSIKKHVIAILLSLSIIISDLSVFRNGWTDVNANQVYEVIGYNTTFHHENYTIDYRVTSGWNSGYSVIVSINNIGNNAIDNWALSMDMSGQITNIWNAYIYNEKNVFAGAMDSLCNYIIKNNDYNKDIASGESVTFGYSVMLQKNQNAIIPKDINMVQGKSILNKEDYEVTISIPSCIENSFTGYISITNKSTTDIEDWSLDFNSDLDFLDIYSAYIVKKEYDGSYYIKNKGYNSVIKSGESIILGFTASGIDRLVNNLLSNDVLYDIRVEDNSSDIVLTEMPSLIPTPTTIPVVTPMVTVFPEITPSSTDSPINTTTPSLMPTYIVSPTPTITSMELIDVTPTVEIIPSIVPTGYEQVEQSELLIDEDGDGLPMYMEIGLGTDPSDQDTDHDGIPDMVEFLNDMDPLFHDETFDHESDTDNDGVTDYDEIFVYNTNAVDNDSDKDGLKDLFEIEHGLNPLVQDSDDDGISDEKEKIVQKKTIYAVNFGYEYEELCEKTGEEVQLFGSSYIIPESFGAVKSIAVQMTIAGDIEESVYLDNIFGIHVYSSRLTSRVGIPVEITSEAEFECAKIIFEYDEEKLGDCDEEDLCLAWFDEESGLFKPLTDSVVDTELNTVSVDTSHFSKYMLINKAKWKEDWQNNYFERMQRANDTSTKNDVLVAVDTGCNFFKSNELLVKRELKRLADSKADSDRIGILDFYQLKYLVDYSKEEDPSISDGKEYETYTRRLPLSNSYISMRAFLNSIQIQDKHATVIQELEEMRNYYDNLSSEAKSNKVIIWVSSTILINDHSEQRKMIIDELESKGIIIYQLLLGNEINSSLIEKAEESVEALGGELYVVKDENDADDAIEAIKRKLAYIYPDYELVFLFNPGQSYYRTNAEEMEGILVKISDKINTFGKNVFIGLTEIYRSEIGTASLSATEGFSTVKEVFKNECSGSLLSETISDYKKILNGLKKKDLKADDDFVRDEIFDYFYKPDNNSSNKKKIVLISENIIRTQSEVQRYIDSDIELYVIYTGKKLSYSTKKSMKEVLNMTGGSLFEAYNEDEFEDAVSVSLAYVLGKRDEKDTDKDGISDSIELAGMVLPDSTIVYTNPRNGDSDNDGLSDGFEMGVDRGGIFGYYRNDGDVLEYSNELIDNSFMLYVNARSNPNVKDSDNDGYDDFEETKLYENCLCKDVLVYGIKDYVNYFSVDTSTHGYYDSLGNKTIPVDNHMYGGNQEWFYDEYIKSGINDDFSKRILEGGCGVIASADSLIWLNNEILNKYSLKNIPNYYSGSDNGKHIRFSKYDEWVRKIAHDYITPKQAENIAKPMAIFLKFFASDFISGEIEELTEDLASKISMGTGTYGTDPIQIKNGLNKLLKDLGVKKYVYNAYYREDTSEEKLERIIIDSLKKNIPVIIQDTGKLNYIDVATGVNKSLSLHFVTGTQIIIDRIRNEYKLICSSWSKMIEIDLKEFFSTESYLDELLDKPYLPHLNISEFIMTFMNSGQAIVVLDNISGR